MWGQKVIEATPNEINCGHLSTLRDHQGYHKQFVWVKGELIGKGTFGKVYLALNVTTGEIMAVKQVRIPKAASDPTSERQQEALEALNAEVATMKDLDHLNIVQYLGFETFPNVYNLFLEYVPGGSVGTCLRLHGRFEHDVIKSLTKQVLLGLSYLHKCGILHRDLKADNLLLDLDGVCKISDFGISKRSNNIYANDAGMSMQGTIFWMAPEVIHNVVHNEKQGYSAKVDIWSLGCVVLEMFAGRRPWSNDEAIGAMYKLGKTRLAPPIPEDTLPYVLKKDKDFLDLCFTIDPELRPTANELLMNSFCELDDDFNFLDTKLARLIKFNDKRADGFPQLDKPSFDLPYS
ncbi:kinase-like protein [Nadsonia fulvescens var. elongata DSM 6958]|uniref:Kinase-like protein n=1 Tax=Nadsonia fulvescens var. elongata DSM 6958 TaxID=857566 RepID=A0A1E3PKR3_9ASCO|nr:kinase-like protein [Nadsonia fulvescens var. elongata DSM 6958]